MNKAAHSLLVGLCAATFITSVVAAEDKPRLVSMDYCADQFALALADPEQVVGLSPEADDIHSFYRHRAHLFPQFGGSIEEVLKLDPDLVLRSFGGNAQGLELIAQQGIQIISTLYTGKPDEIFDNLAHMGAAMGQVARTKAMLADYRQRLDALRKHNQQGLRVAYITSSGFTGGTSTYINSVIELAGFRSVSSELGIDGWMPIPLESYVTNPPDLIIASFFDLQNRPPDVWKIVRHPKFSEMMAGIPTIYIPGRYLACSGYFFIDAAEYIRAEAKKLGLLNPEVSEVQP